MDPHLHRTIVLTYRETVTLGGDTDEAFEAALAVINEALPDLRLVEPCRSAGKGHRIIRRCTA